MNSPLYRFIDEKGFIARPLHGAVILERELTRLKAYISRLPPSLSSKEQQDVLRAVEILDTLPQIPLSDVERGQSYEVNVNFSKTIAANPSSPCRAVLMLDRFTTSQGDFHASFPSINQWGWKQCLELAPLQKVLTKALQHMIAEEVIMRAPELSLKMIKRASTWCTQYDQGLIKDEPFDPTHQLVQADCFAIYVGGNNKGFLDGRGQFAPLGGARLFESQASAEKTIASRGLSNAAVVCIKAQMTSMAPDQTLTGDITGLKEAIAFIEKKQLLEALDMATPEQLEQAVKKRRM